MNLEVLKARYPKLYKACIAEGVERERDRTVAHIELGEKVGAMRTAFDAIQRGLRMSPELFTAYASAGRNRADIRARLEDQDVVDRVILDSAEPPSTRSDPAADAVLQSLKALVGGDDGESSIEDVELGKR